MRPRNVLSERHNGPPGPGPPGSGWSAPADYNYDQCQQQPDYQHQQQQQQPYWSGAYGGNGGTYWEEHGDYYQTSGYGSQHRDQYPQYPPQGPYHQQQQPYYANGSQDYSNMTPNGQDHGWYSSPGQDYTWGYGYTTPTFASNGSWNGHHHTPRPRMTTGWRGPLQGVPSSSNAGGQSRGVPRGPASAPPAFDPRPPPYSPPPQPCPPPMCPPPYSPPRPSLYAPRRPSPRVLSSVGSWITSPPDEPPPPSKPHRPESGQTPATKGPPVSEATGSNRSTDSSGAEALKKVYLNALARYHITSPQQNSELQSPAKKSRWDVTTPSRKPSKDDEPPAKKVKKAETESTTKNITVLKPVSLKENSKSEHGKTVCKGVTQLGSSIELLNKSNFISEAKRTTGSSQNTTDTSVQKDSPLTKLVGQSPVTHVTEESGASNRDNDHVQHVSLNRQEKASVTCVTEKSGTVNASKESTNLGSSSNVTNNSNSSGDLQSSLKSKNNKKDEHILENASLAKSTKASPITNSVSEECRRLNTSEESTYLESCITVSNSNLSENLSKDNRNERNTHKEASLSKPQKKVCTITNLNNQPSLDSHEPERNNCNVLSASNTSQLSKVVSLNTSLNQKQSKNASGNIGNMSEALRNNTNSGNDVNEDNISNLSQISAENVKSKDRSDKANIPQKETSDFEQHLEASSDEAKKLQKCSKKESSKKLKDTVSTSNLQFKTKEQKPDKKSKRSKKELFSPVQRKQETTKSVGDLQNTETPQSIVHTTKTLQKKSASVYIPPKFYSDFKIPKRNLPNPLRDSPKENLYQVPAQEAAASKTDTWLQKGQSKTIIPSSSAFNTKIAPLSLYRRQSDDDYWFIEKPPEDESNIAVGNNRCEVEDILEGRTKIDLAEEVLVARSSAKKQARSVTSTPRSSKKKKAGNEDGEWTPRGIRSGGRKSRCSSTSSKPLSPAQSGIASRTRSRTRSPSRQAVNPLGFSRRYSSDEESDEETTEYGSNWNDEFIETWLHNANTATADQASVAACKNRLVDIQQKKKIFNQSTQNYVSLDKINQAKEKECESEKPLSLENSPVLGEENPLLTENNSSLSSIMNRSCSGERNPSSSREKNPSSSGEKNPSSSGEKNPSSSGEKNPLSSGEKNNSSCGGKNPSSSSKKNPSSSSRKNPSSSSRKNPSSSSSKNPSSSSSKNPSSSSSKNPSASSSKNSLPSSSKNSLPSSSKNPLPSSSKNPLSSSSKNPSSSSSKNPSSSSNKNHSSSSSKNHSSSSSKNPSSSSGKNPSASSEKNSLPSSSKNPSSSSKNRSSSKGKNSSSSKGRNSSSSLEKHLSSSSRRNSSSPSRQQPSSSSRRNPSSSEKCPSTSIERSRTSSFADNSDPLRVRNPQSKECSTDNAQEEVNADISVSVGRDDQEVHPVLSPPVKLDNSPSPMIFYLNEGNADIEILEQFDSEQITTEVEEIDLEKSPGPVNVSKPWDELWKSLSADIKYVFELLEDNLKLAISYLTSFIQKMTEVERLKTKARRDEQIRRLHQEFAQNVRSFWEDTNDSLQKIFKHFSQRDLFTILRKKLTAADDLSDPQSFVRDLQELYLLVTTPTMKELNHHCGDSVTLAAKLFLLHNTKAEYMNPAAAACAAAHSTVQIDSAPVIAGVVDEIPRAPSTDSGISDFGVLASNGQIGPNSSDQEVIKTVPLCIVCSENATLTCYFCSDTFYCAVTCQLSHWQDGHYKSCRRIKVHSPM